MEYMEKAEQYLAHTYNRFQVVVDKAEGVYIYDVNGKKYLDFASGIGVSSLGYGRYTGPFRDLQFALLPH